MATRERPNDVLKTRPLVSVLVTIYQHAPFIEACLHGILEQRIAFAVELLVGDDESTDGTREICERIAAAHPDRIRLFLRSRKDLIKIFGKPTGRANFLHLMSQARGTYVALCEGDDHWIDPMKLQRQVDAMELDRANFPRPMHCSVEHGGHCATDRRVDGSDGTQRIWCIEHSAPGTFVRSLPAPLAYG